MGYKIISAEQAFEYAKTHYPIFPSDWGVSEHFAWNDVFKSELKEDGLPPLTIYKNAQDKQAPRLEKIRKKRGKPMNVHCWYRSLLHNLRVKAQGYKPAMHSSHLYALATDWDESGVPPQTTKKEITPDANYYQIRIEKATTTWVHTDAGNPYINDYKWGLF